MRFTLSTSFAARYQSTKPVESSMQRLPRKLKKDSIVEALFECRFSTEEVPELVVGKLSSAAPWADFAAQQLPAAAIPAPVRHFDANMAYLTLVERRSADGTRFVRIGDRALSVHRTRPYPVWEEFGPELKTAARILFEAELLSFKAVRFGLRYVNAFTEADHGVRDINDLELKVEIAHQHVTIPVLLAYQKKESEDLIAIVRLLSRAFVANPSPPDLTVLIDLDVSTPNDFDCQQLSEATDWIERAHRFLKREFFALFTSAMQSRLYED